MIKMGKSRHVDLARDIIFFSLSFISYILFVRRFLL